MCGALADHAADGGLVLVRPRAAVLAFGGRGRPGPLQRRVVPAAVTAAQAGRAEPARARRVQALARARPR